MGSAQGERALLVSALVLQSALLEVWTRVAQSVVAEEGSGRGIIRAIARGTFLVSSVTARISPVLDVVVVAVIVIVIRGSDKVAVTVPAMVAASAVPIPAASIITTAATGTNAGTSVIGVSRPSAVATSATAAATGGRVTGQDTDAGTAAGHGATAALDESEGRGGTGVNLA
jgi:hypothetical protein